MATATRAKGAQRNVTKPAKREKPVTDVDIVVSDEVAAALTELRSARNEKSIAEAKEKRAKEVIFAALPKQGKRKRFVLRHADQILGKISWRARTDLDKDLVMQGWPEAFEACKRESTFQVIN